MSTAATFSVRTYSIVLAVLIVLTVATVGISFVPLTSGWHVALGLSIGAVKALLVGLFFMHLIRAPGLTRLIVVVAMIWLLVLICLTMCDYVTRGMVPGMPGH